MAKQFVDKKKLAHEKRDLARRARRLALVQTEPEAVRLTNFAAELEQEAEALERSAASVPLPPVGARSASAATHQQVQQQVQQQSAGSSTQAMEPKQKD